jgi:hypothetical protein
VAFLCVTLRSLWLGFKRTTTENAELHREMPQRKAVHGETNFVTQTSFYSESEKLTSGKRHRRNDSAEDARRKAGCFRLALRNCGFAIQ